MTATPIRRANTAVMCCITSLPKRLKAQADDQLPIVLQAHPNWQEAVRDAFSDASALPKKAANEMITCALSCYCRPRTKQAM